MFEKNMPNNDDIIVITAARPGLWVKERLSPGRWLREKFHKDYSKTMDKLRQVDDAIYEWVRDIDVLIDQLKERKKSPGPFNDKKLVDIAIILGAINKRFKKIDGAGKILEEMNEKYLERFEDQFNIDVPDHGIGDLSPEDKRELDYLREEQSADDQLMATAGMWDDLKKYWISKKLETEDKKKRREAVNHVIQQAQRISARLKKHLKTLSKARAAGDVGQYIDTLRSISEEQQRFESDFVEIYNTYVRSPVEKMLANKEPKEQTSEQGDSETPTERVQENVPEIEVEEYQPENWETSSPENIAPQFEQIFKEKSPTHKPPFQTAPPNEKETPETEPAQSYYPSQYPNQTKRDTRIEGLEFEGIKPEEMEWEGTKTEGPKKPLEMVDQLRQARSSVDKAAILIKNSELYEEYDPELSAQLLTLAENIISNGK